MDPKETVYALVRHYFNDFRSELPEPLAIKIDGYIRSRNLEALCSLGDLPDITLYDVRVVVHLRQMSAFLKKNAVFADPDRCNTAARKAFLKAESVCRRTNRRLDHYYVHTDRLDPELEKYMRRAKQYISRVLGDYADFIGDLPRLVRVTAGATATRSRRASLPYLKVSLRPVCTPRAGKYLHALGRYFGYQGVKPRYVVRNRVETVPKNWKTERTIACEPDGNVPLQLAFDIYAKERLKKFGIDLSDQSRNQRMAMEGSISGKYSTIDLSMASDTLAYNTVMWLLPESFWRYLDDVRCPAFEGAFGPGVYAKFSSMGNGATFALETLIFASACYAVGSKGFSVYGDDIVIQPEYVHELMRFMKFLGFTINTDKSFTDGPFRESCGVDCLSGQVITPQYIRGWNRLKADLCHNINVLAGIAKPGGALEGMLIDLIKSNHLPLVPFSENTQQGIHVDIPTAWALKLIKKDKRQFLRYKAYVAKTREVVSDDSRSAFLWYLDRYRIGPFTESTDVQLRRLLALANAGQELTSERFTISDLIRSRTPASDNKYVRKWIGFHPGSGVAPGHLYRWSDILAAIVAA